LQANIRKTGKHKKKHRQQQKDQPLGQTVPGEGSGRPTMLDEGSGRPTESVKLEKDEPLCKAEMEGGSALQYESVALEVPGTRHREYYIYIYSYIIYISSHQATI